LRAGKTSIVISVVREGSIAERGRHEELLYSVGLYSELYELHFGEGGESPARILASL
jgi:hypothetical protein